MPAISRPRKRTSPTVGRRRPVTTLTRVVLPAPLGPTIETNSPSATLKDMLLRALNAPNALETLIVSNKGSAVAVSARAGCISSPSLAPVREEFDGARETLWHEDYEQPQHPAQHTTPVVRD